MRFGKLSGLILAVTLLAILILGAVRWELSKNGPYKCKNCNVILVSIDTLGAEHMGCYGYERNTAENLCKFGEENIFFENSYASGTWTLPSHYSMMTGLTPPSHGMVVGGGEYAKKDQFLPKILSENGYETIFHFPLGDPSLFGATLADLELDGSEYVYDYKTSLDEVLARLLDDVRVGKKAFLFLHTYRVHAPYVIEGEEMYVGTAVDAIPSRREEIFSPSIKVIRLVIDFLGEELATGNIAAEREKDYYGLIDYLSGVLSGGGYDELKVERRLREFFLKYYGFSYFDIFLYNENWRKLIDVNDGEHIDYIRALYDQAIYEMDRTYAKTIIDFVMNSDLRNNTILIFTSDHGEEFMEHGQIEHKTIYNPNIRTPLVAYLPGFEARKVSPLVSQIDLAPSILDFLDIRYDEDLFEGLSFNRVMFGRDGEDRVLSTDGYRSKTRAIYNRDWKIHEKIFGGKTQVYGLYDMNIDYGEANNLLYSKYDLAVGLREKYEMELAD